MNCHRLLSMTFLSIAGLMSCGHTVAQDIGRDNTQSSKEERFLKQLGLDAGTGEWTRDYIEKLAKTNGLQPTKDGESVILPDSRLIVRPKDILVTLGGNNIRVSQESVAATIARRWPGSAEADVQASARRKYETLVPDILYYKAEEAQLRNEWLRFASTNDQKGLDQVTKKQGFLETVLKRSTDAIIQSTPAYAPRDDSIVATPGKMKSIRAPETELTPSRRPTFKAVWPALESINPLVGFVRKRGANGGIGTCFMVAPGVVVTALHVIRSSEFFADCEYCFVEDEFVKGMPSSDYAVCRPLEVLFVNRVQDIVVIKVEATGDAGAKLMQRRQFIPIYKSVTLKKEDPIQFIHFPDGTAKVLYLNARIVSSPDKRSFSFDGSHFSSTGFGVEANLFPGSSGCPAIRISASGNAGVVGFLEGNTLGYGHEGRDDRKALPNDCEYCVYLPDALKSIDESIPSKGSLQDVLIREQVTFIEE